ncbi:MAG: FadR family transcriptional regulator [Bryobacter sp.]|jgi:GntR family transcriptional repressor for pyruvate dehydrogenase complex|nr:FadR family transcriptional regulator [Bryobacter sp.]
MSPSPARPTDKDGITNQLITRLKSLISSGVLTPGAKLPPERELAPAFGVSRSSLRHALKALEIMGVLTQRVGDGTYLAGNADAILQEPFELLMLIDAITLDDLLETRLIVEPELAARAAGRATLDDLRKMNQTLEAYRRGTDHAILVEADLAFHRAIFEAARNPICTRLFSLIHRAMASSILLTSRMVDWDHTLQFHRPIFAAIERRRPDEARAAMIAHLSDAKSLISELEEKARKIDAALIAGKPSLAPPPRKGGKSRK